MTEPFILAFEEYRRLHERGYRAQQAGHREVVGLIATTRGRPRHLRLIFLLNASAEPGRWELRSNDVTLERRRLRNRGWRPIGVFHSHPLTQAVFGRRDHRSTPTGWVHLVYDVCGREARLYRVRKARNRREIVKLPLLVRRSARRS